MDIVQVGSILPYNHGECDKSREKPSVATDIAKVLGITTKKDTHYLSDDIIVTWAIGHLVGLKNPDDYDPNGKIGTKQ